MKTQIFTYKGNLASISDMENGKFINDPMEDGQLGMIIHTNEIQITKEAKEFIRRAKREGGSFAELQLTKHGDGSGSSIGILSFGSVHFGESVMIGRDCELSVLDDCEEIEMETPESYKNFIDNL